MSYRDRSAGRGGGGMQRQSAGERSAMRCPRVLVVDDNALTRDRLAQALGAQYRVEFASGQTEAIAALRRELPDLLVSEVDLADGDGFGLCEEVRAMPRSEHLPIMLLTGRAAIQDKVAGFQAGADDYVVKPLDARVFSARVRLLCRIKGLKLPSNRSA